MGCVCCSSVAYCDIVIVNGEVAAFIQQVELLAENSRGACCGGAN